MARFLVTGAAGFIGRALCQHLIAQGHDVIGLDAFVSPSSFEGLENLLHLEQSSSFKLVKANLLEQNYAQYLSEVDLVFHLAGLPGVRTQGLSKSDYLLNNLEATQNLIRLCQASKIRKLIFASSSSVYGLQAELPCTEDMTCQPISDYAHSKYATEIWLEKYSHIHSLQIVALRPFTVYGPGQRPDMAFRRFFEAMESNQTLTFHEPEKMSRDFTYLSDVIQGFWQTALWLFDRREEHFFQCFNLGSGQSISLQKIILLLENLHGKPLNIKFQKRHTNEVISTWADLKKSHTVLNYSPHVNLTRGLSEYWQWFQSNKEGRQCPII